ALAATGKPNEVELGRRRWRGRRAGEQKATRRRARLRCRTGNPVIGDRMTADSAMRRSVGIGRAVFPRTDRNYLAVDLGHDSVDEIPGDGFSLRRIIVHSPNVELTEDVRRNRVVVAHVDRRPAELRIADHVEIRLWTVDLHPHI